MDLKSLVLHGERIKKILDNKFRGMQIASYKRQNKDILLVINWMSKKNIIELSQFLAGELYIISTTLGSSIMINLNQSVPQVFVPVYRYHKKLFNNDISDMLVMSIVEELMISEMKAGLPANLSQKDVVDSLESLLRIIQIPTSFSRITHENKRKLMDIHDAILKDLK